MMVSQESLNDWSVKAMSRSANSRLSMVICTDMIASSHTSLHRDMQTVKHWFPSFNLKCQSCFISAISAITCMRRYVCAHGHLGTRLIWWARAGSSAVDPSSSSMATKSLWRRPSTPAITNTEQRKRKDERKERRKEG
jgi:hypothetical protein